MNKSNRDILIMIVLVMITAVGLILASLVTSQIEAYSYTKTQEKCCQGHPCSDTYYDEDRDVCVLTMCPYINRTKCEYEPTE